MLAKLLDKKIGPVEWFSTDQRGPFERNLTSAPWRWIYRDKKVIYNFNSDGYRCPEWKDIDWSNSIVFIGCSYTLGVGLDEEDTLPNRVKELTGIPTINLGISGSSNHLMLYNSLKLLDAGIRPRQVVVMFSDISRLTYIREDGSIKHFGNWIYPTHTHHQPESKLKMDKYKENELEFYDYWISENNSDIHGRMAAKSIEGVWKGQGIKFLGCSAYHGQLADTFISFDKHTDKARDLQHPGIETIRSWANTIANVL
jgi:hypothetical protein